MLIRVCSLGITKKINSNNGIALTFDDGPNPEYTIKLLDLLKEYGIKATFFVVGSKVKRNPEIIKRMHEEGHTIGIHHFHHVSSWILSPIHLWKQLEMTEKAINECTNEKVVFYRPPWGHFNMFTPLSSKKYRVIMWSGIFGDWKVEKCKNTLLDQLRSTSTEGSILLLHDCGETLGADKEAPGYMIEMLKIYLQESKEKGTHFITLKDL
ncbi:polysaccharide deacetylase family protein [Peribacillus simplex]|uniref:polysaccharide deacetylase family protein n=1 Tax=Peribacillus simplex TaxID=1478 RepID=UPI003D2717EE